MSFYRDVIVSESHRCAGWVWCCASGSIVNELLERYDTTKFSFEEYSFPALEMIVCRYYGYIPRVK